MEIGLGRHIGGWANIVEDFRFISGEFLAITEIDDNWLAIFEHDVRGFEIAVDEALMFDGEVTF
jgi:hypothetical protein